MSVLIKMEMPKSCWDCPIKTDVNLGVGVSDGCELLKEMIPNPTERLPNCPLIPVPPHGDLIDRDALPKTRVEWEDVLCAPTIIPADKEGEGWQRQLKSQ